MGAKGRSRPSGLVDSLADAVGGPALFIIDNKKFLAVIDNHKIAMSCVWRRTYVRGKIEKPGAVLIHHIRSGEGSLNEITVEATGFIGRETAVAIERDARDRDKLPRSDLFTFELDAIGAL